MSSSSVPLSTPEGHDGAKETPKIRYLSRREMLGLVGSTSIAVTLAGCGGEQSGSSSSPSAQTAESTFASVSTPEGPLSVSGAPNLPEGFTDTFTSRYIDRIASDPEALRGSFELYRALEVDFAQAEERKTRRLTMPVLVVGGTASVGDLSAEAMKLVADDVQSVVIPGAGHWLAEEAPDEFLAALTAFLAQYRNAAPRS